MTQKRALELAKDWHDSHDQAEAEESAECFAAAERLRMAAADIEHELRVAGFDAMAIWKELEIGRRTADMKKARELDKAAARHKERITRR